jgi:hypothetical protein
MNELVLAPLLVFKDIGRHIHGGALGKSGIGDITDLDVELKSGKRISDSGRLGK